MFPAFALDPPIHPGFVGVFYNPVYKKVGVFVLISVFSFKMAGGGLLPRHSLPGGPANHRAAGQCFLLTSGKNVFLI
ncbi:hypothetical protein, partial [Enterobacter hormaechei]